MREKEIENIIKKTLASDRFQGAIETGMRKGLAELRKKVNKSTRRERVQAGKIRRKNTLEAIDELIAKTFEKSEAAKILKEKLDSVDLEKVRQGLNNKIRIRDESKAMNNQEEKKSIEEALDEIYQSHS